MPLPRPRLLALTTLAALASALLAAPAQAANAAASPAASAPANASAAAPSASPAAAPAAAPLRVLAAHPVVHGLAQQLLQGSGIELLRMAPARLPANRLPAYLAGRGQDDLMAAAAQAHAALTLRSIWPDDQLYPLARRANIRIVEIDVANPIEGELPGLTLPAAALGDAASAPSASAVLRHPPWQDSANLARMATLMTDALARLAPQAAPRLQANLAAIQQRLQQAEAQASRALAQASDVSVLLLSPRMQALASALQLEAVPWQAPEKDDALPQALAQALAREKPRAVLAHAAPDDAVAQAIAASGAQLVVLSESAPDPVAALAGAMQAVAQALSAP
ncbi:metal ABC transporter substrate-binding protein [Vandammella animalimorsus]|uniref:Metal ABC transporter substrate-binding protein n=1 Tax=Vandammella animalimorsus TaxID=2029117 RepID=A0A3M6R4S6_9BURK|nr:zinc ABC transporter substrate-binding protein [Vandammella animalimorsus]RMX10261.1 metal ABC transporter substrate-binding protein [Vandammella animalimorsus]